MRTVELRQCTRTLKFPSLQDMYDIITSHNVEDGLLHIDMKHLTVGGHVKGLAVSHVPPYKAAVDRHLVFASGTSVHISNGVIALPSECALMLSGTSISFSNVCITGEGLQKYNRNPYLICVHGANSQASFDDCVLECESKHSNTDTLVVRRGALCNLNSTRLVASPAGNALKVLGGQVTCKKRCLVQGGIIVTSGGLATSFAPQINPQTAQWHRSKGGLQPQAHLLPQADFGGKLRRAGGHSEGDVQQLVNDVAPDQKGEEGTESDKEDVNNMHELPAACMPAESTEQHEHRETLDHHQQQQQQQHEAQACSVVLVKNSEVRGGTVSSISLFGSLSRLEAEGCIIGGSNFGCHAAKRSRAQLLGCEVVSNLAAIVVTGGGSLVASQCTLEGGKIGVQVERQGTAHLTLCKLLSLAAPAEAPCLPPPPKPGFLPSFHTQPASVEVRHEGSCVTAVDCQLGKVQVGELGAHCIAGGRFALELGVAAALEGGQLQFRDFMM